MSFYFIFILFYNGMNSEYKKGGILPRPISDVMSSVFYYSTCIFLRKNKTIGEREKKHIY